MAFAFAETHFSGFLYLCGKTFYLTIICLRFCSSSGNS